MFTRVFDSEEPVEHVRPRMIREILLLPVGWMFRSLEIGFAKLLVNLTKTDLTNPSISLRMVKYLDSL